MLNAVIVVLRETLEAAFFISLMLIYCEQFKLNKSWLPTSLFASIFSASIASNQLQIISDSFEGVGQEFFFAGILILIWLASIILNALIYIKYRIDSTNLNRCNNQKSLPWLNQCIILLMSLILILAITLEGSEIIIYLQNRSNSTLIGALLGAGIGLSIGILTYYLIRQFKQIRFFISLTLLNLIGAGMLVQSISFLTQAGFIDAGMSIWNSNGLINENSLLGQLLYALIGYESSPTAIQVYCYFTSLFLSGLIYLLLFRYNFSNGRNRHV